MKIKLLFWAILFISFPLGASAVGDCSQYGVMATYDYLTESCKCMSGYVFKDSYLGAPQCVRADTVCSDKLGYGAEYDSLSKSCTCRYGYVLGKDSIGQTQCITEDQACKNQLGYHAKSVSGDKCGCNYGYVIDGGKCVDGDQVCQVKHGIYSSYDDSSNSCACDNNYTFDDSDQCVKKQNNVYFTLKELDTDGKKAIVRSDYDYGHYLISYGIGCYATSFQRYLRQKIVMNLGTDFNLDSWDKIVLQDDDEVCDITRVERADSNTTLKSKENSSWFFIPTKSTTPSYSGNITSPIPQVQKNDGNTTIQDAPTADDFEVPDSDTTKLDYRGTLNANASFRKCPSTQCSLIRYYAKGSELHIIGEYKDGDWYQIDGTTDANATGQWVTGWIHHSLFSDAQTRTELTDTKKVTAEVVIDGSTLPEKQMQEEVSPKIGFWKRIMVWLGFTD